MMPSKLCFAAAIFVALTHCAIRGVDAEYRKFQALGFGIYTGGAVLCPDGCRYDFRNECRPGEGTVRLLGVDFCFGSLNPECQCDKNGCKMGVGTLPALGSRCYLGEKSIKSDVRRRIAVMKEAVEVAYEEANKDSTILKIFNAPEFFFRGPDGAYELTRIQGDRAEYPAFLEIQKELTAFVAQERFEDWLFVFGTVVTYQRVKSPDGRMYEYQNFSLVLRGYDPNKTSSRGKRFLVPKRYVSGVDFLDRIDKSIVPYPTDEVYDPTVWEELRGELAKGYGFVLVDDQWLAIDDMLFSIEICLDHAAGRALFSSVSLFSARGLYKIPIACGESVTYGNLPRHLAHVSIVTSAGFVVETRSLVPTTKGSIFLQDGFHPDQPQVLSCRVVRKPDGTLGWNKICEKPAKNPNAQPTLPFKAVRLYKTRKQEARALKDLYSLVGQPNPAINVYDPIPLARIDGGSVCRGSSSKGRSPKGSKKSKGELMNSDVLKQKREGRRGIKGTKVLKTRKLRNYR